MGFSVSSPPGSDLLAEWIARGHTGDITAMFNDVFKVRVLPGEWTVDTLPDPSLYLDKYALVTDLFGEKRDYVLASKTGTFSYWQPVRPCYDRSMVASSNMTLYPLKNGSITNLTGTISLGTTREVTLSTVNAWPGAEQEIKFTGTLAGALNILGVGLGSGVGVLLGTYKKFSCELVSGVLQWKQLV